MGNNPSREQMRQHDPFSAGKAKGVWMSENKMTQQSFCCWAYLLESPLVFGSSSDVFVTYDNLTPCKVHREQKTLKPAHCFQKLSPLHLRKDTLALGNIALRFIHFLLYQDSFKLGFSIEKWEEGSLWGLFRSRRETTKKSSGNLHKVSLLSATKRAWISTASQIVSGSISLLLIS